MTPNKKGRSEERPFLFFKPRCYSGRVSIFCIDLDFEVHCQEAEATARTGWARQCAQVRFLVEGVVQTTVDIDAVAEGVRV